MAVLIDTDLLVDLERGVTNPEVNEAIGGDDRAISVITLTSLPRLMWNGLSSGPRRVRRVGFGTRQVRGRAVKGRPEAE